VAVSLRPKAPNPDQAVSETFPEARMRTIISGIDRTKWVLIELMRALHTLPGRSVPQRHEELKSHRHRRPRRGKAQGFQRWTFPSKRRVAKGAKRRGHGSPPSSAWASLRSAPYGHRNLVLDTASLSPLHSESIRSIRTPAGDAGWQERKAALRRRRSTPRRRTAMVVERREAQRARSRRFA